MYAYIGRPIQIATDELLQTRRTVLVREALFGASGALLLASAIFSTVCSVLAKSRITSDLKEQVVIARDSASISGVTEADATSIQQQLGLQLSTLL